MEDEGRGMGEDSLSRADITDVSGSSNSLRCKRSLRCSSVPPGDVRQDCVKQKTGLVR